MQKRLWNIWNSFPVQLFVLHLKRNHFLALSWFLLVSLTVSAMGSRYGVPLLFLDPEYMGQVNFSSFCIVGAAFGGFVIVWNLTSYILNAHNFSFLATLSRPFGIYSLNNAILPAIFLLIYIFSIVRFQVADGLLSTATILFNIAGFITGMCSVMLISMVYFFRTNKDIFQIIGIIKKKNAGKTNYDAEEPTHDEVHLRNPLHTEFYLNHNLRWKHARSADHYPESIIRSVYKQHHANALIIEIGSILMIVVFGVLMDNPWFRIPAAASIFILINILIVLIGAYYYWVGAWKILFLVVIVFGVSALMRSDLFTYRNKVYGLDYKKSAPYSLEKLKAISDTAYSGPDTRNMLTMLENWKNKFSPDDKKPKIVFINCSGGGIRASSFVMQVMQTADSITGHKLMEQCPLITGASGGMIAAAYFRELYMRQKKGEDIQLYDPEYANKISSDLLNALSFTIVVNDLFYPWQPYTYYGEKYRKDRGYMFEKILNENTDSVLCKPLGAYAEAEYTMQVPMLLFTPTIINDERKLYIASQPVSYLAQPLIQIPHFSTPEIDGADIHYLLADNTVNDISFTSILRMNCTFPYILPNVHLPTEPGTEVMDAGIRDNYGIQTSAQFIATFNDWIRANTSGVVIVNIRAIEQEMKIKTNLSQGVLEKIFSPVGNLYANWVEIQDYQNDQLLHYLNSMQEGRLEVITFEYQPTEANKRASLSLHLTAKEKLDILHATHNAYNKQAFTKLAEALQ